MHIPSERIYKEIQSEIASLWIVPANGGKDISLLVKAPMSAIKALIVGCPLELLLGRQGQYLCHGVRIIDNLDAPIFISGVIAVQEELDSLKRLISERRAPMFLFNEMGICVAWADIRLNEEHARGARKLIGDFEDIYVGSFDDLCSHALDCFCYSTDETIQYENALKIPLVSVSLHFDRFISSNNYFYSAYESHNIKVDELDEGETLERIIWASLEPVFPLTLHKSPNVKIGEKTRELTDVMSFDDYRCFLIESKDLSVLNSGLGRSQARRTAGVQKQVKKAIKQLVGACRAVKRGEIVFDQSGEELSFVRDKPLQCIILITELENHGDWSEIAKLLCEAILSTGSYFHLMDLSEFVTLLKGSKGNVDHFDVNLMSRCEKFAETKVVHLRTKIVLEESE